MREPARMAAVQPPVIPMIADLVRRHPGTVSLGQGVVAFGPPPEALAALAGFPSRVDDHRYQAVHGLPPLLDAITAKLEADNDVRPDEATRIVVTAGGNMAFMNAILAVTDPGDEVILQAPYYFNHDMAVVMAGCRAVAVPTDAGYQLQPARIREAVTARTRAIVTVSPNNPTGAVYPEAALREVNAICAANGVYHVHDEAYEYFTCAGTRHFSPAAIGGAAPHTISLFSMSKSYGMASWRIGYMLIPAALFTAVNKIQDTILICPPVVSQHVALAALRVGAGYCRAQVRALDDVRSLVLGAFRDVADICTVPEPRGAFYCLVRLHAPGDPLALAERLIVEDRVAVVPGTAFGVADACSFRVSYGALERDTVAEGMARLVRGLRRLAVP